MSISGTKSAGTKAHGRMALAIGLLFLFAARGADSATRQRIIETVAGGGPIPAGSVGTPYDIAYDDNGDLLIADTFDAAILKVDSTGQITITAGGNGAGFSGDGGLAVKAQLNYPDGIESDGAGGFYIADAYNNRIRRVDADGIITTVAGGGNPADGLGDGGPAVMAALDQPAGVTSDGAGGFYIADGIHSRIRRVNAKGIITTVAGNGEYEFAGDGGPATAAHINSPTDVALDGAGGFYVIDGGGNRIRQVNAKGIISTVAGNGTDGLSGDGGPAVQAQLNYPRGAVSDGSGGLIIADGGRIRRVDENGIITTIAGGGEPPQGVGDGGPAIQARVYPGKVILDRADGFIFADIYDNRIRRVDANGIITTLAGDGQSSGYAGDGGPALQARFSGPSGVSPDGKGGYYVADSGNNRIRYVDVNGIVSTVAGNGAFSFSGDGSLATKASLSSPSNVLPDGEGGYYIADTGNNRIRHVNEAGIISTVAGDGSFSFGGDGGLAVYAQLTFPVSVAFDGAGGLLIADLNNNRVRRVDENGIITTVAGGGNPPDGIGDGGSALQAKLYNPSDVTSDGEGGFYIVDQGHGRIRRVDARGIITTVAGSDQQETSGDGGLATQARLTFPYAVVTTGAGGFLFADQFANQIRRVDANGIITTIVGSGNEYNRWGVGSFSGDGGPAIQGELYSPSDIALSGNDLYIADKGNNRIRKVFIPGAETNHPPTASNQTVDLDENKSAFIALVAQDADDDALTYAITRPPAHGMLTGTTPNLIYAPDPGYVGQDSFQYVASDFVSSSAVATVTINVEEHSIAPNEIVTVAGNGSQGFSGDVGPASRAILGGPTQVSPDGSGGFFVADTLNGRIRRVDPYGVVTTVAGSGADGFSGDGGSALSAKLSHPTGVSSDGAGGFLITDYGNHRIRRVDAGGIITTVAGSGTQGFSGDGGSATKAQLSYPMAAKPDGAGGFFVVDWGNHRIRRVSASGVISTVAGGGSPPDGLGDGGLATKAQLSYPTDAAPDGAGGFYVADYGDHRIRHVGMRGIIATVAGSGASGFSGDGGPATKARLAHPTGVAPDGTGGFLIADRDNRRIRRADASGFIATVAGGGNPADGLGDGGLATEAALKLPTGVSSDGAGGFFISDWGDNRIRRVYDVTFVNPIRRDSARAKSKTKDGR